MEPGVRVSVGSYLPVECPVQLLGELAGDPSPGVGDRKGGTPGVWGTANSWHPPWRADPSYPMGEFRPLPFSELDHKPVKENIVTSRAVKNINLQNMKKISQ